MSIKVRFWGVRGSVPTPISNDEIEKKLVDVAGRVHREFIGKNYICEDEFRRWLKTSVPFSSRATYGGNTTCVEVRVGDELIILDMGTGLRELGIGLMPETLKNRGIHGTILQSHVHWDHVQGFPFWPQVYMPNSVFDNRFKFYGGKEWDQSLEEVLHGQMDSPVCPVNFRELAQTSIRMEFDTVHDGKEIRVPQASGKSDIRVLCRKLNHPQETYGYRIEWGGKVVAFCTDHEPYAGQEPHRPLVELARGADVFITDCQYSHDEFVGKGGKVQKMGWGHSYPEYIAMVADAAKPKKIVTTHHDPQSDDRRIEVLARQVGDLSGIATEPAHEGLTLEF